jgi:hypothetical protein
MQSPAPKVCVRCGEPRILAPECPRCGVLYAKARASRPEAPPAEAPPLAPAPEAEPLLPAPPEGWGAGLGAQLEREAARREERLRLFALPGVLGAVWLLDTGGLSAWPLHLLRMFLHELGHAVTAWFCGHPALPTLWVTHISERSTFFFALVAFALMGLVFRGVLTHRPWLRDLGLAGLALQFVGSVWLTPSRQDMAISFGGDGGAMVLGTLLMLAVYAPPGSWPRRGELHWGLAFIGAASLVTTFRAWWATRTDFERLPFGEIEGVGLSDASKLVERHGWDELTLIHRYTTLGLACLALLALAYGVGVWRSRAARRALGPARGG